FQSRLTIGLRRLGDQHPRTQRAVVMSSVEMRWDQSHVGIASANPRLQDDYVSGALSISRRLAATLLTAPSSEALLPDSRGVLYGRCHLLCPDLNPTTDQCESAS